MKTLIPILLVSCAAALSASAQTAQPSTSTAPATTQSPSPIPDTPYSVVDRGPNHRVWQKFSYETTVDGHVFAHSHSYTEIATGLSHLVGNQWVDSSPE